MRPSQRLEIKVGLLIIVGILATVVMIMISDKISFDRYYRVTAYMADAGGLRTGSPVTLSGIAIGHVEHIRPADDARGAIKADLRILTTMRIPADAQLQLASSGIFGDSSLAFVSRGRSAGARLPVDGSAEVVAAPAFLDEATAQAKGILRSLSGVLDDQTAGDAKRLVRRAADLADQGATLAEGLNKQNERLAEVLDNLRSVTADLKTTMANLAQRSDSIAARIDSTLGTVEKRVDSLAERIDGLVARLDGLAGHVDDLLVAHRGDLDSLIRNLRDTAAHAANITGAIDSGGGVVGQLLFNRDLAKDVNDLAIDLTVAVEMLNDHPSDLVWGPSKRQIEESKARRERLKMQRAFKEEYGSSVGGSASGGSPNNAPAGAAPSK